MRRAPEGIEKGPQCKGKKKKSKCGPRGGRGTNPAKTFQSCNKGAVYEKKQLLLPRDKGKEDWGGEN